MDYNKALLDDIRMRAQKGEYLTAGEREVARQDLISRLESRFNEEQAIGDWTNAGTIADGIAREFALEAYNLGLDLAPWKEDKNRLVAEMDNILAMQNSAGGIARAKETLRTRSPAAYARLMELEQTEDPGLRQQMLNEIYSTPEYYGMADSDVNALKAYLNEQALAIENARVATKDEARINELRENAAFFAKQHELDKKSEALESQREALSGRISELENAIRTDQQLLRDGKITRDQFNTSLTANNARIKELKESISQTHREILGNLFDKYIAELSPEQIMFTGIQQKHDEYKALVQQREELTKALAAAKTPETQQHIRDRISVLDQQLGDAVSVMSNTIPLTTGAGIIESTVRSQNAVESALANAARMNDLALTTSEQLNAMVQKNKDVIGKINPANVQKSLRDIQIRTKSEREAAARSLTYQTEKISDLVKDIGKLMEIRSAYVAQGADTSEIDEHLATLRKLAADEVPILEEMAMSHDSSVASASSRILSDWLMFNDHQRISEILAQNERLIAVTTRMNDLKKQAQASGIDVETLPEYQALAGEYQELAAGANARSTELSRIMIQYQNTRQDINSKIAAAQRRLDNAILAQTKAREQGFGDQFGQFDIDQARAELAGLKAQRDSTQSVLIPLLSDHELRSAKEAAINDIIRLVGDYGTISSRSASAWKDTEWLDADLQKKYGGNLELAKAGMQTYGEQIMDAFSRYIDIHSQELLRKNPKMSPADARAQAIASAAGIAAGMSGDANSDVLDTLKKYDIHEANTLENIVSFGISKIVEDSRVTKYRANADLMAGVLANVMSMAEQAAEMKGISEITKQQLKDTFGEIAAVQKQYGDVKDWFARKDFEKRIGDTTGSAIIMVGSGAVGGLVGGAMQSLAEAYGASRWATTAVNIIANGVAFHASNNIMSGEFTAQAWSPTAFAHSVAVMAGISGMNSLYRTLTSSWANEAAFLVESRALANVRTGKLMEGALKTGEFGYEVAAFSVQDAISRASAGQPIDWGDIILDQAVLLGSIKTGGALARNVRETFIEENTWKWKGKSLEVARAGYEKRMNDLAVRERQLLDSIRDNRGLANAEVMNALRNIQAEKARLGDRLMRAEQEAIKNRIDNLLSGREWKSLPPEIKSRFASEDAYRSQAYRELADRYGRVAEARNNIIEPMRTSEAANEIVRSCLLYTSPSPRDS